MHSSLSSTPNRHSLMSSTSKSRMNYAILKLHQEAKWMKLGVYPNTYPPSKTIKTKQRPRIDGSMGINILINTGAALSLIKVDIILT